MSPHSAGLRRTRECRDSGECGVCGGSAMCADTGVSWQSRHTLHCPHSFVRAKVRRVRQHWASRGALPRCADRSHARALTMSGGWSAELGDRDGLTQSTPLYGANLGRANPPLLQSIEDRRGAHVHWHVHTGAHGEGESPGRPPADTGPRTGVSPIPRKRRHPARAGIPPDRFTQRKIARTDDDDANREEA